jgi:hypothetical protein
MATVLVDLRPTIYSAEEAVQVQRTPGTSKMGDPIRKSEDEVKRKAAVARRLPDHSEEPDPVPLHPLVEDTESIEYRGTQISVYA